MPLNLSGPISLAGATAGQSIAVELGLSATGNISLNQANVRTLAGVPSGAITMPTNFYGKSASSLPTVALFFGGTGSGSGSTITRINESGALIGSLTNITNDNGQGCYTSSGTSTNIAVYFGGRDCRNPNIVRINKCGSQVGVATTVGTIRNNHAGGRASSNLLIWGGWKQCCCCGSTFFTTVTRVNGCGNLVGSEISQPNGNGYYQPFCINNYWTASTVSSSTLIFSGRPCTNNSTRVLNACGAVIGSRGVAGPACNTRYFCSGTQIGANACRNGGNATFYGGILRPFGTCVTTNSVTRVNTSGAQIGSITNVGTVRWGVGAATVGSIGVFFAGTTSPFANTNVVTRINVCGSLVGSQTNVGNATRLLRGSNFT
jgi:hypothetical protein